MKRKRKTKRKCIIRCKAEICWIARNMMNRNSVEFESLENTVQIVLDLIRFTQPVELQWPMFKLLQHNFLLALVNADVIVSLTFPIVVWNDVLFGGARRHPVHWRFASRAAQHLPHSTTHFSCFLCRFSTRKQFRWCLLRARTSITHAFIAADRQPRIPQHIENKREIIPLWSRNVETGKANSRTCRNAILISSAQQFHLLFVSLGVLSFFLALRVEGAISFTSFASPRAFRFTIRFRRGEN